MIILCQQSIKEQVTTMAINRNKLPKTRKEIAQTMVEFAIVFPILLLVTYGIIEFGRMVFIYTSVTSAAREGARYGAASGIGANGIERYADCAGIRTAVQNGAFLVNIPSGNIEILYEISPGVGFTTTCGTVSGNPAMVKLGDRILVRVTAYYSPVIPFVGLSQSPVPIQRQNARTILVDVEIDRH